MAYDKRLRRLAVNIPTATTTTLVAANQLGANLGSIKVYQVLLNGGGANVLTFNSGATPLYPIVFTAAGSAATLQDTNTPWMETQPGQALTLTTSTGGGVTGELWYALA